MTDPVQTVLEALERAGSRGQMTKTGERWQYQCPAHDDRKPSLSIGVGEGGKVLLRCHAGCQTEAICHALGLSLSDLMPSADDVGGGGPKHKGNGKATRKAIGQVFLTAKSALDSLRQKFGRETGRWTYYDESGCPVALVCRWDTQDGKEIRPISRYPGGWRIAAMPEPRCLYNLPQICAASSDTVIWVAEGEKCADALNALGLVATTSAGGANAASHTDWTPLAGRRVVVLSDNDEPGRRYAEDVARLAYQAGAREIRILDLARLFPGLPEGFDVADLLQDPTTVGLAEGTPADELRKLLERWASEAPTVGAEPWPEILAFDAMELPDFPTHVLPDALRNWVEAESRATQTPADLAGLLALAVCSACIARRVEVEPRPGWREPVNLFVAVLLEPGNRKSAVFTDATEPLRKLEAELIERARPEVARQQSARRRDEARLRKLEKLAAEKNDDNARWEADELSVKLAETPEPTLPRLIVDDVTVEKLGMMLAEQNGRIASMSPEGGVFDLMAGLYSKNGIPQFDTYVKGHSGDRLITDRVTRKSVCVERPALTCAYAMQPAVIEELVPKAMFRGRGLLARFLYAAPRSWVGKRRIAPPPVPDAIREAYHQVVYKLAKSVEHITDEPIVLRLTDDAEKRLRQWEEEIEAMLDNNGEMESIKDWGGKLAGATVRIAGVLHCVENGPIGHITRQTMEAVIAIGRYLIPHAETVLNIMAAREDVAEDDARYVLRWIERHGKREFTKSEAQQHCKRRFPRANDIDVALAELTRRGYIRPKPTDSRSPGRPPSPVFEVNPLVFTTPPMSGELESENPEKRSKYSKNSPEADEQRNLQNIQGAFEDVENCARPAVGGNHAGATGVPTDGTDDDGDWLEITL